MVGFWWFWRTSFDALVSIGVTAGVGVSLAVGITGCASMVSLVLNQAWLFGGFSRVTQGCYPWDLADVVSGVACASRPPVFYLAYICVDRISYFGYPIVYCG